MTGSIKASPFHRPDFSLAGFVLSGRWPDSTKVGAVPRRRCSYRSGAGWS